MATTLQSPGVSVSVIDESFYTPAAPGTVPLILVATSANKTNSSGTGLAQGTVAANVGKVWTITSQRDLSDTFGIPSFVTDANQNPLHGSELNEYGLQAAYSLLGVSSKAYVVRADVDLSQITGSSSIPEGLPVSGTYWVDTGNTLFGINEWDATNKVFTTKTPLIIDDSNSADSTTSLIPDAKIGAVNSYAVVITSDNQAPIYYKNKNNKWSLVGSNNEPSFGSSISSSTFVSNCWATSWPTVTSTGLSGVTTGSILTINGNSITLNGADLSAVGIATSINSQMPQNFVGAKVNADGKIELYASARANNNAGTVVLGGADVTAFGFTAATYKIPSLQLAPHTQVPQFGTQKAPTGSVYVKTTSPGKGASWSVKLYSGATNTFSTVSAPVYASTEAAIKALDITGGTNIAVGSLVVESNYDHGTGAVGKPALANFKLWRRSAVSPTVISGANSAFSITRASSTVTTVYSFDIAETIAGSATVQNTATVTVATIGISTVTSTVSVSGSSVVAAINGAGLANVTAILNSDGTISINHKLGGDIQLTDLNSTLTTLGFTGYNMVNKTGTVNLYASGDYDSYTYRATNWKPLVFEALSSTPATDPVDGTLWYDTNLEDIDILIHNGTSWSGYQSSSSPYFGLGLDPNGPIIASTAPAAVGGHSDGTDLVDGDIWIDTSSIDGYGQNIYVWNGTTLKWDKQDPTDQTSENGWVFDDARWSTAGQNTSAATIKSLLTSDYVDPDAPDPALYPRGTRLWNLRRSGFNIKKYIAGYVDINADNGVNLRYENDPMDGSNMTDPYATARWVSISPNSDLGSGTFGRFAQRAFVVKALKSLIDTNQTIRDTDNVIFNLIACPGYTEVVQNMVALNQDRGSSAFVIGDSPFRLTPTGTTLSAWGGNTNGALDNGETGAVTYDDYMGFFYPSGYTNDNLGNNIVVPPSHMMLRTIAVSDQIAYPWFAPSGIRRGLVDNVTSVGYLSNGEFIQTSLPQNLRDVLYQVKVNPIATLNGVGVTNFGNLTRAPAASALDRINVARLVAYVRRQLAILSQPYIFEPNDTTTRREIKSAAESLLTELVSLRGLYDFIVVCDDSNNTQARVDRNELWMDIAIEPVKAVEFIYIPLRLVSTGSIKAGTFKLA